MQSALALDRFFSFWTHEAEYTLSGDLTDAQLRALIDASLNRFLPTEIFQSETLQDLKGCGPQPLLDNTQASADQSSPGEELLFIAGHVPLHDEREETDVPAGHDEGPSSRFQLQLVTKFERFIDCHHISHSVFTLRQGGLSPTIGFREVALLSGITFNHFRIGLEVFHERFTGKLGVAPVGDQRLFLEAEPGRFKLLIGAEHLRHMTDLPLAKDGLFARLREVFQDLFAFDIQADYLRLVQSPTSFLRRTYSGRAAPTA